jgi:hypothetical protein
MTNGAVHPLDEGRELIYKMSAVPGVLEKCVLEQFGTQMQLPVFVNPFLGLGETSQRGTEGGVGVNAF